MPHATTHPDAPPTLDTLLSLPIVERFKQDRKTTVWRVRDAAQRDWVVKRFESSAWYQRLRACVGRHPAQLEQFWADRLRVAGVPTVPVVLSEPDTRGRWHLVSAYHGVSLYNWLRTGDPKRDARQRHDLARQAGTLTGQLLRLRVCHRDFKASNLAVGGDGKLRVLDTGDCTGFRGTPLLAATLPMLTTLLRNLQAAAGHHATPALARPTRTDRLRFYRALVACWDTMPDGLQHLPRHRDLLKATLR